MRAMKGRIMGLGVAVIFGSAVLAVMGLATEFEPAAQPTPIAFTEVCGQAPGVLVESDSVSITDRGDQWRVFHQWQRLHG